MANEHEHSSHLWDDNPSEIDLLGFDAVVAPIVDAALSPNLDPLTVGVHARWGGGKSTILGLIEERLDQDGNVLVIRTNPWEYDDHEDVKGTLIAEVLSDLEQHFKDNGDVKNKVKDLFTRISWSRVGKVVAKSVILQSADLKGLAEALTPQGRETPESMAGFRKTFAELVELLPETHRVVVLVDDLDRCSPSAVVATLEAIKLFLSVRGMAFVIAADQNMVKDAIEMKLGSSAGASRYAQRYLDKIVQLPVSLPVLPPHEAEAYVGLLLSRSHVSDADFEALVSHVQTRRMASMVPLLAEMGDLPDRPTDDEVRLASQLVHGLRTDTVVNPREIKRFMNGFQVRRRITEVRGVTITADVLAKLMILEDRYVDDFRKLLNTPELERPALLEDWAAWANGEVDTKPEGVSEHSKEWAASEPSLTGQEIGTYLTLAASFSTGRTSDVVLDSEMASIVSDLLSDSDAAMRTAVERVAEREPDDQSQAIDALFTRARLSDDADRPITALIEIANNLPGHAKAIAERLFESHRNQVGTGHAVSLASSDAAELKALASMLVKSDDIDEQVVEAIKIVLNQEDS